MIILAKNDNLKRPWYDNSVRLGWQHWVFEASSPNAQKPNQGAEAVPFDRKTMLYVFESPGGMIIIKQKPKHILVLVLAAARVREEI